MEELATFYFNRGNALAMSGRAREAISDYERALSLRPGDPVVLNNLGNVLQQDGQVQRAIEVYRQTLSIRPDYAGPWSNLGKALEDLGELEQAIEAYRKAISLRPDFAEAHFNLGNALRSPDRVDESIEQYRRALELRPNHAATHSNLGNALKDAGQLDEAIACYRRAWELNADARAAGNLLYCLYLHPDYGPQQIYQEHVRWNEKYARALAPQITADARSPSSDRRLRIGYVSPDFREHPVGRFILPLLSHHDCGQFEIICYSDARRTDLITAELRRHANVWCETSRLTDEQFASQIREDQIDILVDLSLHTAGNRLLVFARKPAPVQVTYLSYPGTSGLETMDYRLTDPYLDPPDDLRFAIFNLQLNPQSQKGAEKATARDLANCKSQIYSEKSIGLPSTFWCYAAPDVAPPVQPAPALTNGFVTFGCLNQFCKVSRVAIEMWCEILRNLPRARLILHAPQGSPRERTRQTFAESGVDPARLTFVNRLPLRSYLEQYHQIDIALDPFPFAGGTTTCDALWMGVPVVTLTGQTAVSRAGASILSNVGLSQLIARSESDYICVATDLAAGTPALSEFRTSMRQRMQSSPLMNESQFARDIEVAFRKMWTSECAPA